jgi:hypothetical protein
VGEVHFRHLFQGCRRRLSVILVVVHGPHRQFTTNARVKPPGDSN